MGNSFFKYKQFTVHQEKCAMKVCTDTSLFGALIEPKNPLSILDIGTGTGVLSLMIAQKTKANITAVEIDEEAAIQARNNFNYSPWKERFNVINDNIINYSINTPEKFELIISNPPFFQGNMLSEVKEKNKARHSVTLTLEELSICVNNLLSDNGQFWVLLPQYEATLLEKEMNKFDLFVNNQMNVKNYIQDSKISRTINCFQRKKIEKFENEMAIYRDKKREYTKEFSTLLKDYYLYL